MLSLHCVVETRSSYQTIVFARRPMKHGSASDVMCRCHDSDDYDDDNDDGMKGINDNAGDDVAAQGSSQMSGNNATLTRALSAESLLSQTTVASPKFCRGQFHIHSSAPTNNILVTYGALQVFILYCIVLYSHFSDIHKQMTMTSFGITLYGQCC